MAGEFLCLVSLHGGHHNKTPSERFGQVEASSTWAPSSITPLELIDWISAGKAWVGCHLSGGRSEANAGASNLIVLDIDGDLSLEDFWAKAVVARCCLFTATSCSHTAQSNRFRAVFRCDEHDEPRLHKAIYHHWLAVLALELKDNSGEKPERLWFGNDAAEIQFGAGEAISWDIIERAKEALAAEEAKRLLPRPARTQSPADANKESRQAAWIILNLLRSSVDGDFTGGYWKSLLMNAAATGSLEVQEAFLEWHSRGYHVNTQKHIERRLNSRVTQSAEDGFIGIRAKAKDQHGGDWQQLLPEDLRFVGGGAAPLTPPQVLMRARSKSDILPMSPSGGSISFSSNAATVPDVVPTAAALEQLASRASIMRTSAKAAAAGAEPAELTLADKLRRLYMLRAHGVFQIGDDLQEVLDNDYAIADRELLGEVLGHPGYCNQPSEVDRDLLVMFRKEHGMTDKARNDVETIKLGKGHQSKKRFEWLIPGFLAAGCEHVLYAKAGVGKTTLGLHMVRAVTGDPALSSFLDSGPINNHHLWQRAPILFIGTDMCESAEEMTVKYLEDFQLYGLDFLDQVDWWFETETSPAWQLNLRDLSKLYSYLESHFHNGNPVAAVFVDSMKAICPDHLLVGQQGFKDYIKLVKVICRRFKATLVWIHHSSADGTRAQGITRITENSDANFHLKRDDKTKQLTLEIEKQRGGRARTLYINPFQHIPQLLPNPEEVPDRNDIEDSKERMVLQVLADHFGHHRLLNMTSSAEFIESSYKGMKIGEIEEALQELSGGRNPLSRTAIERTLRNLRDAGRLEHEKTRYRLMRHFQLDLPNQAELELPDPTDADLPGWDA